VKKDEPVTASLRQRRGVLFAGYAVTMAIVLVVVAWHTRRFNFGGQPLNRLNRAFTGPQFFFSAAVEEGETISSFRHQIERQGWSHVRWPVRGGLRLAFELADFNTGNHTASKATPAVSDDGVYIGSDTGAMTAFDGEGRMKWRFLVNHALEGIHATAAVDESSVFFGAYNGRLYALDRGTGRPKWVHVLGDSIGASVSILGASLFVSVEANRFRDGYVVRLRRATGEIEWISENLGEQIHSSPAIAPNEGIVVVGVNNGSLVGLDMKSGQIIWRAIFPGPIKGTPMIQGGKVYATSWGGEIRAVSLRDGRTVWRNEIDGGSMSSPTYVPQLNLVVVGSRLGAWMAYDADGGVLVWRRHWMVSEPQISSALAMRFGSHSFQWRLWLGCGGKMLCLLDAATSATVAQYDLPVRFTGVPVVHGNRMWMALGGRGPLLSWIWE
jgi:outer membrane protein assembly factor BamB